MVTVNILRVEESPGLVRLTVTFIASLVLCGVLPGSQEAIKSINQLHEILTVTNGHDPIGQILGEEMAPKRVKMNS